MVGCALGVVVGGGPGSLGFPHPKGSLLWVNLVQSEKMMSAMKAHMPSGYAAVGAAWKPPLSFLPIMGCLWL